MASLAKQVKATFAGLIVGSFGCCYRTCLILSPIKKLQAKANYRVIKLIFPCCFEKSASLIRSLEICDAFRFVINSVFLYLGQGGYQARPWIGLDHINRSKGPRAAYLEKAIKIHN